MRNRMMDRDALGFERHDELLAEAQRLHRVSRAMREAREAWEAQQARQALADMRAARPVAARGGQPIGRPIGGAGNGAPRHRRHSLAAQDPGDVSTWRLAAGRMGSSLVTLGRRLERLGARDE